MEWDPNEEVLVYCIQKSYNQVFKSSSAVGVLCSAVHDQKSRLADCIVLTHSLVYKSSSRNVFLWVAEIHHHDWWFITQHNSCIISVFRNDVYVLGAALLSGYPPATHMLTAFPFLLRIWWLFLQLLSLVLGSSVLEPDLHLNKSKTETLFSLTAQSQQNSLWEFKEKANFMVVCVYVISAFLNDFFFNY